jgi:hypothetical protein
MYRVLTIGEVVVNAHKASSSQSLNSLLVQNHGDLRSESRFFLIDNKGMEEHSRCLLIRR